MDYWLDITLIFDKMQAALQAQSSTFEHINTSKLVVSSDV